MPFLDLTGLQELSKNIKNYVNDKQDETLLAITELLDDKVDKDGNKVLSDNNYTNADKVKLDNLIKIIESNSKVVGVKGSNETDYRTGQVSISKDDLGLNRVENKNAQDIINEIDILDITTALGYIPINPNIIDKPNGLATLNNSGKIDDNKLSSNVDEVIEGYLYNGEFYTSTQYDIQIVGEDNKLYRDLNTNTLYAVVNNDYAIVKGYIPSLAELNDDSTHRLVTDTQISNWDNKADTDNLYTKTQIDNILNDYATIDALDDKADKDALNNIDYNDLINTPNIYTNLSDLTQDSGHLTVTQAEKDTWNSKITLADIPTISESEISNLFL